VSQLLDWYATHGRDLVIRRVTDPYAIWIAETMSQQTQIERVGEALPGFLASFPDTTTLAAAPVGDVLRAWGGLGYPRRALALRRAARQMLERFGGRVPDTVADLEGLPGIGPYTARAVASTAYGVPATALDVNARRVLARVTGTIGSSTLASRSFGVFADGLAPHDRSADWNHALMDLGALICRPRPACPECPLRSVCASADAATRPGGDDQPTAPAGPRTTSAPFRETHRYVRGRVLASLRDQPVGRWLTIDPEALSIEPARVDRALGELAREGFIELDARGRARLPLA
jgi:A/G-specific adenine glycosylase